jgi:hypothetical protein
MMFSVFVGLAHVRAASAEVAIEVLNPRGEVAPAPIFAPSARIPDLAGKKVGVYWNNKAGGEHFWDVVEAALREKAPAVKIVRFSGGFEPTDAQIAAMTKEVDAFFYGVGD